RTPDYRIKNGDSDSQSEGYAPSGVQTRPTRTSNRVRNQKIDLKAFLASSSDEADSGKGQVPPQVLPCVTPLTQEPYIDKIIEHRNFGGALDDREFLIKWVGKCHYMNTWERFEELSSCNVKGIRKIDNYLKKLQLQNLAANDDEMESILIRDELERQLDADAMIVQRIVRMITVEVPKSFVDHYRTSPLRLMSLDIPLEEEDEKVQVTRVLVKWLNQPYEVCTWENDTFLRELGFDKPMDEYLEREDRLCGPSSASHPLNAHDLGTTSFEPYEATPTFLKAKFDLRDYQLIGINWIVSRMKKGFSVLLADEMGLGKTIQTIAVVGHLLERERIASPIMVMVPQSTVDNWNEEFERWLPQANVVVYHGGKVSREVIRAYELGTVVAKQPNSTAQGQMVRSKYSNPLNRARPRADVIITTPSILTSPDDLAVLRSMDFFLMIVDEAHSLKNRDSKRFKEMILIKSRYKLLLSGTPLHNNLEELWSLLHFMNHQLYSSYEHFQNQFCEIEKLDSMGSEKSAQLQRLQQELSRFVLRRVKRDVLKSLPTKVERILRVELSPIQVEMYKNVLTKNFEELTKSTGGKSSLQNICMELKKVCNHTLLLSSPQTREQFEQELLWGSGKVVLLEQLLKRLKAKGNRVLIFSQMVKMLNHLGDFLNLQGYKHQKLDGTMSKEVRKKAMDHFNAPDSEDFVFLLSTKAGGLGINLTSADTVIIYDSDWNPQNDLQAEARAHRLGQTRTVNIYRLVTKDTIEVEILERAKQKLVLDTLVVQGLNQKTDDKGLLGGQKQNSITFSREELASILKFGASGLFAKDVVPSEINLDTVLMEAEDRAKEDQDDDCSAAGQLISAFNNISDFRYEAPEVKQPAKRKRKGKSDDGADVSFWSELLKTETPPEEKKDKKKVEREDLMTTLSSWIEKCDNDGVPRVPPSSVCAGGRLPCSEWSDVTDACLLSAVYKHGFSNWNVLRKDQSLSEVDIIKKATSSQLKSRATRLLRSLRTALAAPVPHHRSKRTRREPAPAPTMQTRRKTKRQKRGKVEDSPATDDSYVLDDDDE
ncbi:MAG: uncharacterized protein KVP18_000131, partial [Porospora cf. gigantea A]|uniref:uncharacterized protein n=2 Tax=Porospora cf. gigantea A TaxID=2853593 RepID=UPI0035595A6A